MVLAGPALTSDGSPQRDTADRVSRLLAELAAPPSLPSAVPWEDPLRPGERLDRFEIRALLGRGGFGVVYEAWDAELGRAVALKTLRAGRVVADGSAGTMKQEAEAVAKLNHAGIVTLHDVCKSPRGYYLVMERLEGTTLAQRLADGPLPWKEAVVVACQIAEALGHAHERGVLHRDLKPANVFLCEGGRVKLLDFGLAHLLGASSSSAGGTPAYMAPEQSRGDPVDARADVFALGVVLVEMLTGAVPRGTGGERARPAGGDPRLVHVPARLARLAGRLLARDPGGRPASGAEAAAELRAFARSLELRRRGAWAVGALATCGAAVAVALAVQPPRLPAGRLVVAMADLDNRTGDPRLDGFAELLGAALEQSRRVALVDRDTLVRALTNGGVSPGEIGEADAVRAARSATAQLVLVPSLRSVNGGLELSVNVVDSTRGRSIFGAREKAVAFETLYAAVDRLATRVRAALAEDASEAPRSPAPVSAFAPASPEVLRLFAEGERLNSAYDYEGARAKWEAAIALDPSFALPRLSLLQGVIGAFTYLELDDRSIVEHARALRRDLARLPEALRPWAETVIMKVEDGYANHTEYVAALDGAIAARPEQPAPYIAAANELLLRRGDAAAARPYVDRAIEVSPLAGLGDVLDYLVLTERLDEALDQARLWVEKAPAPISFHNLSMVHSARGEVDEALDVARTVQKRWGDENLRAASYVDADELEELDAALDRLGESPPQWRWADAEGLALRGRVRDAIRTLDGNMPHATRAAERRSPGTASWWLSVKAAVLLARGDRAAVERAVGEARRISGPEPIHAWVLAEAGASRLAGAMSGSAPDRVLPHRMARAINEWKAGDREAALAELEAITSPASDLYRAEILAGMGRYREAAESCRRYRRLRYGATSTAAVRLDHLFFPRSLYLEASSLEALGEDEEARRVITRLLRLWKRADPDLPLLSQAMALERRLRSPGSDGRR